VASPSAIGLHGASKLRRLHKPSAIRAQRSAFSLADPLTEPFHHFFLFHCFRLQTLDCVFNSTNSTNSTNYRPWTLNLGLVLACPFFCLWIPDQVRHDEIHRHSSLPFTVSRLWTLDYGLAFCYASLITHHALLLTVFLCSIGE